MLDKIKELRKITSGSINDCKEAIENTNNIDYAIKYLREKGIQQSTKRENNNTNEGRIFVSSTHAVGTILKLTCETESVGKSDLFIETGQEIVDMLNKYRYPLENNMPTDEVKDKIDMLKIKVKENINFEFHRFYTEFGNSKLFYYLHGNNKVGSIIHIEYEKDEEKFDILGKDLAMQVTSMNPLYISKYHIQQSDRYKEIEILKSQMKNDITFDKKPQHVIDKIVEGRLNKWFSEVCLESQEFIKDKITIWDMIYNFKCTVGDIQIIEFKRFII